MIFSCEIDEIQNDNGEDVLHCYFIVDDSCIDLCSVTTKEEASKWFCDNIRNYLESEE